jgi:hypothetical protein
MVYAVVPMQNHVARSQDQTPHEDPHDSVGTTEPVRLLDRMNTWKAFVGVLALCLIINGLLFYRYQQPENSVAEPPPTAPTSRSFATSNEDGEGGQAETQSKEDDAQADATENDQHDSSSDLQGTEAVAYPLDPIYEEDLVYEDGYYPPDSLYEEEVAYE